MAYGNGANGASHDLPQSAALAVMTADDNGKSNNVHMSAEQLQKIREMLSEPFDAGEIKWRVTATSTQQGKHGPQKRGQLVAYADQRAYTDRLNDVFGEWGWTRSYDVQVAQNFERRAPGENTRTTVSAKVVVVSKVTIHGLGSHTGVGEEWAHDENAATRAEAQAFKRACACFGLGRYLYDLGGVWVDLDSHNRPVQTPVLPDWALPSDAKRETQRQTKNQVHRQSRQEASGEEMLAKIRELRQKAGRGLSQFILDKYADGAQPERLDPTQRTIVFEKLADIGKGIDRLRRAIAVAGGARYTVICRELNLASEAIDDIPTRDALQRLLARVEAEAPGRNGNGAHFTGSIGDARGRLLQAARQMAEKTGKRLADIIADASEGKLSLEGLRDLTDADVPLVSAAMARISNGG
jgi:hypothetical protein